MQKKQNKYNAQKCESTDGIIFDSRKERDRWEQLRIMQKKGQISGLQRQVKLELIPNQRGADGKVIERAINYIADFSYIENDQTILEDVKGYRNPMSAGYAKYVLKRKLVLWFYHIQIREV